MYMFKYIMKRLGLMIMTFTIIIVGSFLLIKLVPIVVSPAMGKDAELQEAIIVARGYRDPLFKQLVTWIGRIFDGDFGVGVTMNGYIGHKVWDTFTDKLPMTIVFNVYSSVFAVPIGLLLGIYAALRKNKWQDHVISTGVMVLISVPSYVTAFLLQYFLCVWIANLGLTTFPLTVLDGTAPLFSWPMFRSMIPAILAMSLGSIAGYCRFTRAELTEVLTGDYLLLARTKGLTKRQSIFRHALRNAMVPIFPAIIGEFLSVLSGSLILEQIFSINGVGKLYLLSINTLDYDFFMTLSGFYTLIGLAATIVIDISYGFIDPRIKMGAK